MLEWQAYLKRVNEHLGITELTPPLAEGIGHRYFMWRISEDLLPDPSGEAEDIKEHAVWLMTGILDHTWEDIHITLADVIYDHRCKWIDVKYRLESKTEKARLWVERQILIDDIEHVEKHIEKKVKAQKCIVQRDKYNPLHKVREKKAGEMWYDRDDWIQKRKEKVYKAKTAEEVKKVRHDIFAREDEQTRQLLLALQGIQAKKEKDE